MRRCSGCFSEIADFAVICPHCGYSVGGLVQNKMFLSPGSELSERYIIGEAVSSDKTTVTYNAWDNDSNIKVLIKEFLPLEYVTRDTKTNDLYAFDENCGSQFDKGFILFVDEAKKLFNEDGSIRLFDCIAENNTAYMIMEYHEIPNVFAESAPAAQTQQVQQAEEPSPFEPSPFKQPEQPEPSPFKQPEPDQPEIQQQPQQPQQIEQPVVTQEVKPASEKKSVLSSIPLWLKIAAPAVLVGLVLIIIVAGAAGKGKTKGTKNTDPEETESTSELTEATIDPASLDAEFISFSGHSYACFNNADTWEAAEEYCESVGGHLVTITTKEENDAVWAYVKELGNQSVFIGLSDAEEEGNWKWVTGESLTYTKWTKGEPNAYTEAENYAEYAFNVDTGEWNDFRYDVHSSDSVKSFVCEWEYDVRNPAAADKLSEEQAKKAFGYHIAKSIDDDRVSYNELMEWDFIKKQGNICYFYFQTYTGECIRYFMDLDTGITTSLKYSTKACDYVDSIGEYDFNAWDLIKGTELSAGDADKELSKYLNTDIEDAAGKITGLEDIGSDDAIEYQGDDVFLSTTQDNETKDIKYIQLRGNSANYSLYEITLGMSRNEAFTRLVSAGSGKIIRNDPNTFTFTLKDGTQVSVTCDDTKSVTYVAAKQG